MKLLNTVTKIALFGLVLSLTAKYSYQQEKELKQPAASAEDIHPLLIGAAVPEVTLTMVDGNSFDLRAEVTEKPTVIMFYRGGWCAYCNVHLGQLKTIEDQLTQLGYQIIAISPDSPEKLTESIEKHEIKYRLLSDSNMDCARAFGIAYKVDEKTVERYKGSGIDLTYNSGEKSYLLPVPSVFVIGTDGVIQFEYVNPNYRVRLDPYVLLAVARAALK